MTDAPEKTALVVDNGLRFVLFLLIIIVNDDF